MPISSRHQQILELLKKGGSVGVVDLAQKLNVSPNTIRNDLDALAEQGLIARTHGGATIPKPGLPPQLWPQDVSLPPRANHIVDYALSWIKDGDSLILDNSLFSIHLAEKMTELRNLRVITPSMAVAYVLTLESTNRVVIAGGEFDPASMSTYGGLALSAFREFRADKAFLSCSGVSEQGGLTDSSSASAQIRQAMKEAADSLIVMVESERVGKVDLFPIGSLDDARRIITDANLDPVEVQALSEAGGRMTVCWEGGHQTYRRKYGLGRKVKIGFANLSHGISFSAGVCKGVELAASQVDGLDLLVADNQTNPETAIRNAQEFLKQDIDLLIEYEGTGQAVRPIRLMMRDADIPIIAVDIPIMGATHIGSDHDAVGATAGHELGDWIRAHWGGEVDRVLWLNSEGGATIGQPVDLRLENWNRGPSLSESTSPSARFVSALETLQPYLIRKPIVQQLVLPGGWVTSDEAVRLHYDHFIQLLPSIPQNEKVVVLCLVCETALGFTQAVRDHNRCHQFVLSAFGDASSAVQAELSRPGSCLLGVVNLHPEKYGEKIITTAVKLLNGESVPPAVFIEHEFVRQNAKDRIGVTVLEEV